MVLPRGGSRALRAHERLLHCSGLSTASVTAEPASVPTLLCCCGLTLCIYYMHTWGCPQGCELRQYLCCVGFTGVLGSLVSAWTLTHLRFDSSL